MAPNSRIILTRHAQAEHNVDLDYSIADAPLTALGKKQATALGPQTADLQRDSVDLIVTSPLKRTLQTTYLGFGTAIERLGGRGSVICLPQAQECNAFPCDRGSPRSELEATREFDGFDLSLLTPDWTSKAGFWAADDDTLNARARWVRQWLRARPEATIVLVAHGDILRRITGTASGPSVYAWRNAEARIFTFDPKSVETDDCFLHQQDEVALAGGYGLTSSQI